MGMLSCKGSLVESDEDTNDKHARRLHTFGIYTWTRDLGGMKAFCVQSNKCTVQLAREMQIWCSNRLSEIWPTIASIMLWNIWKSRCKVCLSREESRPKETITALWYNDLIMNISIWRAGRIFRHGGSWRDFPFNNHGQIRPLVYYVDGMTKWCYTTRKWLFPHWQPNQEGIHGMFLEIFTRNKKIQTLG